MKKVDIVIVVFNNLNFDARAFNLANTLVSLNFKVLVVSFNSASDNKYQFDNIEIDVNQNQRLFVKWINFFFKVRKILASYTFDTFIASDLYSLPNSLQNNSGVLNIYDSREIYSALASLNNRKISQKIITMIERYSLKKVNKVIVSGDLDKEYLQKIDYFDKEFFIIKNLPLKNSILSSNYLRKKYNVTSDFKIAIYQGAILNHRGIFPFLNAIKDMKNIFFVLVGDNQIGDILNSYIKDLGLDYRCKIHTPVNYTSLFEITMSADFGISLFEPVSDSYYYALPNKIFEYLNCGKPFLATNLPAIKDLNESIMTGILVDDVYDINEIKIKLNILINSLDSLTNKALEVKDNFSYNSQIEDIKRLVNYV